MFSDHAKGCGKGGINRWSKEDLGGAIKLFCMILQWWIHAVMLFLKPTEYAMRRLSANINYGLWVIPMSA